MSPAPVTMPWRSASGSFATAMSNRSFNAIRLAIAWGDEQSMRILPSQSGGIELKVASTSSLTTSIGTR